MVLADDQRRVRELRLFDARVALFLAMAPGASFANDDPLAWLVAGHIANDLDLCALSIIRARGAT